jgi:hypothetical protein
MMDEAVYLPEMAGASTANNMVVWLIWVGYGSIQAGMRMTTQ